MRNDEQSNSKEQEIVDFIDALPLNIPFDSVTGSALVDLFQPLNADAQARLTVHFLRHFESQLDWSRFRKREREEGRIEDSERNPWEVESDEEDHELRAMWLEDLKCRAVETEKNQPITSKDLNRILRETEEHFGLTPEHRERVVAKLGQVTKSALRLRDILPPGVFPLWLRSVSEQSYDHNLHVAVKALLEHLGPENRRSQVLVAECASLLARQFPQEFSGELVGKDSFCETVERANRYYEESPDNLFLLLWRGVLARWEGDDQRSFELAIDFWQMSDDISVEDCRRVLWMCRETTILLSVEMEWMDPNWEYYTPDESIFEIPHYWLDREEPLISAFVRRAVANESWDANCVAAYLAINTVPDIDFKWWYTDDVLPPSNWIWIAETQDWDCWPNAPQWEVAFRSSSVEKTPDESFLSAAVLLCGYKWTAKTYGGTVDLATIVNRLLAHHAAGSYSNEVNGLLTGFFRVLEVLESRRIKHLSATDGVTIARSVAKLSVDLLLNPNTTMDQAEIDRLTENSEWVRAEIYLKSQLGPHLWSNLNPETQEDFRTAELIHRRRNSLPGEQNFGNSLFHLTTGLLREINIHFWGPIRACKETKGELLDLGLDGKFPKRLEWGAFIKIIRHHEMLPVTLRIALGRRIKIWWFSEHVKEIEELFLEVRNDTAHSKWIDRERANVIRWEIMKKEGMAQRILNALGIDHSR